MEPLSQHGRPEFSLLHISDTHLLAAGKRLYGVVDAEERLVDLLERVHRSEHDVRAVVFTGDLADLGEPDAYQRLKDAVEPVVAEMGARLVWVMGNHDERAPFAEVLLGAQPTDQPLDAVYDIDGLRLIALDTSVPGYHHGELRPAQLEWLAQTLSDPAPHGTLLALHHPPIPTPIDIMGVLELQQQQELWEAIEGSDVRGMVAGHLHYSTHATYRGIPVSVAAALCYNLDLAPANGSILRGINSAHTASLVSIYPTQVVFSELPAHELDEVFLRTDEGVDTVRRMSLQERHEVLSKKTSDYNMAERTRELGD